MARVSSYRLFQCTIFFLFKACIGTTCSQENSYWYGGYYYTYITCSSGCCGTTTNQYCCLDSSWSSSTLVNSVTTTTSELSVGQIVGFTIAWIVLLVIASGAIVAIYKVKRSSRVTRVGIVNNANNIAHTNTGGQHPTNTGMHQAISNNTHPHIPAGPSQVPSHYMYPPPPYPYEVPPNLNIPQQPYFSGTKM